MSFWKIAQSKYLTDFLESHHRSLNKLPSGYEFSISIFKKKKINKDEKYPKQKWK